MDGILPFPLGGHIEPTSHTRETVGGVPIEIRGFADDPRERCLLCPLCKAIRVQDGRYQCTIPSRPASLFGA